jgi:hypothetical protein
MLSQYTDCNFITAFGFDILLIITGLSLFLKLHLSLTEVKLLHETFLLKSVRVID